MAVLGGFSDPVGGRLNVLHLSEDGLSVTDDEMHFTEFNQRVRDVAVNPYTGSVYLALNGPSYTGNGPNLIKEFKPSEATGIGTWSPERGIDIFPNPSNVNFTMNVGDNWVGQPFGVVDLSGAILFEGQLQDGMTTDISNWSAGTYLLNAVHSNGRTMTRVMSVQ